MVFNVLPGVPALISTAIYQQVSTHASETLLISYERHISFLYMLFNVITSPQIICALQMGLKF